MNDIYNTTRKHTLDALIDAYPNIFKSRTLLDKVLFSMGLSSRKGKLFVGEIILTYLQFATYQQRI